MTTGIVTRLFNFMSLPSVVEEIKQGTSFEVESLTFDNSAFPILLYILVVVSPSVFGLPLPPYPRLYRFEFVH